MHVTFQWALELLGGSWQGRICQGRLDTSRYGLMVSVQLAHFFTNLLNSNLNSRGAWGIVPPLHCNAMIFFKWLCGGLFFFRFIEHVWSFVPWEFVCLTTRSCTVPLGRELYDYTNSACVCLLQMLQDVPRTDSWLWCWPLYPQVWSSMF